MATTTPPTPDTLVTLKINIEGSNRRFKLPLRDLGASTLPDKLRFLLAIPPSSEAIFERYSDSAAAFIVLDATNPSVYKQLYRAAKAKLKLRLKVTVKDKEPVMPKPATVEDEEPALSKSVETQEPAPSKPIEEEPTPSKLVEEQPKASMPIYQDAFDEINNRGYYRNIVNQNRVEREKQDKAASALIDMQNDFLDLARQISVTPIAVAPKAPTPPKSPIISQSDFKVYCNNCSHNIPDVHYHCSTCDGGDFDLCQVCMDRGITCKGDHWLIKRIVDNGKYIHSTTETLAPKKQFSDSKTTLVPACSIDDLKVKNVQIHTRTCNNCISELSENNFATCKDCDDFDLCLQCHISAKHGHDPKHAFAFVDEKATYNPVAHALLAPGRNVSHAAVCDGCDKYIFGVRHKCLDCPDWDYCNSCIKNVAYIHPGHRFVPLYENINIGTQQKSPKARHTGIFCDGPLCKTSDSMNAYITGDRYKCAVCHDTDFCASCEACPSNTHNRTHPLIKFKTPVRNVSVTTLGDHPDGRPLPPMGDRRSDSHTTSKATETTPAQSSNAATQVQTVAEVEPTEVKTEEPAKVEELVKVEESANELPAPIVEEELVAHFVRDTVADGTIIAPNSVFEQTWYLRNGGKTSWPAGCSVKYTAGERMFSVDPRHPASVHELVSAAESTTCYTEVAPGQEYGFTVLMRSPMNSGDHISYWRLTTPTGEKFGHRLWCDITVNEPTPVAKEEVKEDVKEESKEEILPSYTEEQLAASVENLKIKSESDDNAISTKSEVDVEANSNDDAVSTKAEGSQMIFPKLDKESPISSIHEETQEAPVEVSAADETSNDDFDDINQTFEEDDGFMTDEEYDILDASDEEYLAEQESKK